MNLADKIITLRKQKGWSQEELAGKLDVSRQSVSKWESAQSVPDIPKIIAMSRLFGVTTDYLLKDDAEEMKTDGALRRIVTMEEARRFLDLRRSASGKIAAATFLSILSPVVMLAMLALTEEDIPISFVNENAAGGIGMAVLLLFIAVACVLFLRCSLESKTYEFLEQENFDTEYGVAPMAKKYQGEFLPTYSRCNVIGTVLCILSVIPMLLAAFSGGEGTVLLGLCVLLFLVGVGVVFFVYAGVIWAATEKLLKEGDYSPLNKRIRECTGPAGTVYWIIVTAFYLSWSFTENFAVSWILWPVCGLLYAAFCIILRQILRAKFTKE